MEHGIERIELETPEGKFRLYLLKQFYRQHPGFYSRHNSIYAALGFRLRRPCETNVQSLNEVAAVPLYPRL